MGVFLCLMNEGGYLLGEAERFGGVVGEAYAGSGVLFKEFGILPVFLAGAATFATWLSGIR